MVSFELGVELSAYRRRRLRDDVKYLYLDGFYVVIRSAPRRRVVLFAMAEYEDGSREILSFKAVSLEEQVQRRAFVHDLYRRGLKGSNLKLVVTDGALGLIDAVRTDYGLFTGSGTNGKHSNQML